MPDVVQIHIGAHLPVRAQVLGFANRVELRFGKAFPVAVLIEADALRRLIEALTAARDELADVNANKREE